MLERFDHFTGRLIALAPRAEAAMNDFLEMITARKSANVARAHRAVHVAAQQHRDQLPHLVHVVALLPFAHFPPGDLGRCP